MEFSQTLQIIQQHNSTHQTITTATIIIICSHWWCQWRSNKRVKKINFFQVYAFYRFIFNRVPFRGQQFFFCMFSNVKVNFKISFILSFARSFGLDVCLFFTSVDFGILVSVEFRMELFSFAGWLHWCEEGREIFDFLYISFLSFFAYNNVRTFKWWRHLLNYSETSQVSVSLCKSFSRVQKIKIFFFLIANLRLHQTFNS